MPRKSQKRGGGDGSRYTRGRKIRRSPTSHLHHHSSSHTARQPENEEAVAEELEASATPALKKVRIANLVRTSTRQCKAILKLKSEKAESSSRALASERDAKRIKKEADTSQQKLREDSKKKIAGAEKNMSVADAKLLASKKKMDEVVIRSRAKLMDKGKLAAGVLEREREASKQKNKTLREHSNTIISSVNAKRNREAAVALVTQKAMSKQIVALKNKLRDESPTSDTVGCDDIVDQTLEKLFSTVRSKSMTRSQAIQYVRLRLEAYAGEKEVLQAFETETVDEPDKSTEIQSKVRTKMTAVMVICFRYIH
jgi:hypothetical protein